MVALGHWLLTGITQQGGHLSGLDALDYVSWGRWVTLLLQVMPVFFLTATLQHGIDELLAMASGRLLWWKPRNLSHRISARRPWTRRRTPASLN